MYSVSQSSRDNRRPQYEVPAARSPTMLSPGIKEVLHMLEALEKDVEKQKKQ